MCNTLHYSSITAKAEANAEQMSCTLDVKCAKADLEEMVANVTTISPEEQQTLSKLPQKCKVLFDGTLGEFTGAPLHIQLKDGIGPHHAWPFPVPKAHKRTLKIKIDWLVQPGTLKKVNHSNGQHLPL